KTSQDLPIRDFFEQFGGNTGQAAQAPQGETVAGLRRTRSSSRLDQAAPVRVLRRTNSVSLPGSRTGKAGSRISLMPMLELMKSGIALRHPALVEFLHLVVDAIHSLPHHLRWLYLNHVGGSLSLKKTIYLTYILDMLVVSMNNSKEFAFELQSHLYAQL